MVLELEVVGFDVVLQHTPLAVTDAPPSFVTFPPLLAEDEVIDEIAVVVTDGGFGPETVWVVKLSWLP